LYSLAVSIVSRRGSEVLAQTRNCCAAIRDQVPTFTRRARKGAEDWLQMPEFGLPTAAVVQSGRRDPPGRPAGFTLRLCARRSGRGRLSVRGNRAAVERRGLMPEAPLIISLSLAREAEGTRLDASGVRAQAADLGVYDARHPA
jgi:hypothetical protein